MKLLAKYKIDLQVASMDSYKADVLSFLARNEKARVLDLESGNSKGLTDKIRKIVNCNLIYGVEIEGGYENANTVVCGSDLNEGIPFESGFDVVVASQIIEHLWNTDGFLKEIYRVLKLDGYAIFSTPNLASWHNLVYLLLGRQPETLAVSDEMYPEKERPGHRRVFTLKELIKLLEFHKFTIEGIKGSSYHPLPSKLAKLACRLNQSRASTITVKVGK